LWGVSGCGRFAETSFIPAMSLVHKSKITALFSHEKNRAKSLADKFGIANFYNSYEEFLSSDIDCVYVSSSNNNHFEQVIKEKNETIKEKEREIASLPEGMAFFVEEELKETISKEMEKELNNIMEGLFEDLKKQAIASVKNKILEKELIGRQEPMVLNVAYLIPEDNIEDFNKGAQRLNQEIQANGFYLETSGPWPAYNFSAY